MKILAIRGRNLASLEGDFEIDFTVEPLLSAGIFAISGPTGAGKSTLLDTMCLALFARTPRTDQAKENNVKLQDVSNRLIRNLSKGYRQRTGLACAVLGFPDIMILDEPTVGLDPKQIIEIRQLIRTLSKDHTVILSSHILAEVQEICDYILIISKGTLVAEGTPEQLEELTCGRESIELTIRSDAQSVQKVLDSIEAVEEVQWLGHTEDSCNIQINTTGDAEELCTTLSLAFAEQKIPVTQMYVNKATLEDIFLELTDTTPNKDTEGGIEDESSL